MALSLEGREEEGKQSEDEFEGGGYEYGQKMTIMKQRVSMMRDSERSQ
jgi:hypothetical protein